MPRMVSNCLSSRFTSSTFTPAPAATRFFRLALSEAGLSRSRGVMDWMMASV